MRRLAVVGTSVVFLLLAFGIFGGQDFLRSMSDFPLWAVVAILVLFGLNLLLVSFRLWRILDHFGMALPPGVALRASIAGQAGSLFVISLFGQVVGRQMILQRFGVTPAVIASLTGYERAVLTVVGGGTCLAGAILLLGRATVSDFVDRISLIEVMIAAGGGLALSFWLGRSHFEARLAAKGWSLAAAFKVLEVVAITLAGQLLVLSAFVLGALALKPDTDLLSLFAAAAVISFAASIPVTVNGWGIREMAAVAMLGHIGISGPSALAVSVLSGLCVTAVTLGAATLALGKTPTNPEDIRVRAFSGMALRPAEIEKAAVWVLATITAALVFFQVHVDFLGATINLNFADPFAILALAAVAAHAVMTRHPPAWRVSHANLALIAISALLVLGFLRGTQQIGVTQWALTARLLGWLVLLGYLCAGYLMSANAGAHGRRRLFETMMATGAVIVVLQVLLRWLGQSNMLTGLPHPPNFEGYAANRNAFAFQMLVCCALLLAYSSVQARLHKPASVRSVHGRGKREIGVAIRTVLGPIRLWPCSLLLSVGLAGLLFSASRAGLITCAVLIVAAWVAGLAERRVLAQGAIAAVLIWQSPQIAQWMASFMTWLASFFEAELSFAPGGTIQGPVSLEGSNVDRWRSVIGGLELWADRPLLGAGLGVFIENNLAPSGRPLVIHSTPVWILAEFGLLGAGIFGWIFYRLGRHALERGTRSPQRRVVGMLLLSF
ncbi:MAG TPA: lysylphosphatidylglycerol synthase transmembrane domain-containing protein, partial [Candidatus Tectomicrobia bacterium]